VKVTVGPNGFVRQLQLTSPALSESAPEPVEVELSLSGFGRERPVPNARMMAME
jgi:hypothetical protein